MSIFVIAPVEDIWATHKYTIFVQVMLHKKVIYQSENSVWARFIQVKLNTQKLKLECWLQIH